MNLSRRSLLKGLLGGAAAVGASRLSFAPQLAHADDAEAPAVVCVYFNGGFNSLFCCAKDLAPTTFKGDPKQASPSVFVDRTTLGTLPADALGMMSVIGVNHGISAHPTARAAVWGDGKTSYAIELAAALGGTEAFRCVTIGNTSLPENIGLAPVDGVSAQQVRDLDVFASVLGASTLPAGPLGTGVSGAKTASSNRLAASPGKLAGLSNAYDTVLANVKSPAPGITAATLANIRAAYGLDAGSKLVNTDLTGHFAGAELAITAGAKVINIMSQGWDSHGDVDGSVVRGQMGSSVIPGLKTFLQRMLLGAPGANRNVVVCLFGDFARSLQSSGHQPNLSACVFGKHVKPGTTGAVSSKDVTLLAPKGDPGSAMKGMWSYFAAAARCAGAPFGANPHGLVK